MLYLCITAIFFSAFTGRLPVIVIRKNACIFSNKTMKNFLHLILLCLLLPLKAAAQPEMIVEHYTKDNGLLGNTLYCAHKDKDGFLWLGTWHGLCSFDGAEFRPYLTRHNQHSDLPPRKVRNIVEDNDGNLWIRNTDNHVYLFDKVKETYHDIYNELKRHSTNVQVIKIQLIENGHVLLLTRNKDLYEAYLQKDGKIIVNKIYDSRYDVDGATMRLRHNVYGENDKYVYWISRQLNTDIVVKKSKRRYFSSSFKAQKFTGFKRVGNYLCVGTQTGCIYTTDNRNGTTRRNAFKGMTQAVSSINIVNGKIFFTTAGGLYSFTEKTAPKLVTAQVSNVLNSFKDRYNKLWYYSERGSLIYHDPQTSATRTYALPTDSLFADVKFKDSATDGLFILLRNGEVWRFDHRTQTMQNINKSKEFDDNPMSPHFFDIDVSDNGTLWLSSASSGLYKVRFPRDNFNFMFRESINLPQAIGKNNGIRAVYQDRRGDIWVGTRYGELYCFDSKTLDVKRRFDEKEIGAVYHIMEDADGNYWFSTKGSGLVMARADNLAPQGLRLTRYTNRRGDRSSLSSNRVYFTYQDSRKRIWVCTFYGGLNLLERHGGKVVFRHSRNGFKHYPGYELYTDVRSIAEDRNGRIWVGTTDGLMSFNGKFNNPSDIKFETYRERAASGVIDNDIYSMYKDREGYIWMGIFGSGLNKIEYYDEKNRQPRLKAYNINEKQGGDVIASIVEDKNRCLWICTESGLASMRHGSSFVKGYDKFAGFPDVSIEDNTSVCLKDGRILVGCRQGLLVFNPSAVINDNEKSYRTFITGFKVGNRELWSFTPPITECSPKYAERIELKHDMSTFTIDFSSPHFSDNTPLSYTYILDGYEEQWHNSGNNRVASYSNVPPGHYKFRVKVNDNISPERVLEVVILPPWWATWWAYIIYSLLILLALYGGLRLVMYLIKIRNEVYINDRLAELKIRFFTNISHELRTPLSLISGPIEEIKSKEKLSREGKEYINLIDRNARKMLMLVNQILDFRKIQNGRMKLHVSYVDINEMIEMLMREFRLLAEERDISFVFEKPEEHVMLWCDAEKMGIVLNNLLSNAFKYTDEGGTICVALEHNHGDKTCTVRVEDDGAGIPEEQLELIFERFHQAENKTADDATIAGTGIGLSLSKEYIAMHHGRIWAENLKESTGVVFSVEIPVGKEHFEKEDVEVYFNDSTAESEPHKDAVASADGDEDAIAGQVAEDKPIIMLIEDNIDMCRMLQLQLQSDYRVFTAHEGGEGLKKIYRHHPDIIITDLMMPGMNGLELLRCVRQDFNISHIPVIVLTAKNTEEDKMSAIKSGANAFIVKPFGKSYLTARINQLLEEQRIFQRKMVIQTATENLGESNKDEYEQHLVKKDIEFINKIHEIIEENLNANDFNIDTIAGSIGLSRSAFFKKLKSLTGLAPVDLVKEIRLNKAAKLIETTDNNITEIAYSVGFRDAGYFGKCFRKKYEMTPKEYRKMKKEE